MDSEVPSVPSRRQVIGSTSDLAPGQRKFIQLDGHEIGVFNIDGKFYALQNRCPHKGGPVCRGRLRPLVIETDDCRVAYERESEILKCPWHQWEFDITTGRAICDPKARVKAYSVVTEGADLVIYRQPPGTSALPQLD